MERVTAYDETLEEDDLLAALFSPSFHVVLLVRYLLLFFPAPFHGLPVACLTCNICLSVGVGCVSVLGEVRVYQAQTGQAVKQFRCALVHVPFRLCGTTALIAPLPLSTPS